MSDFFRPTSISNILNKPIIKLISDAEKIVSNENKVDKQKNKDNDEVVNAFNMVTDELKENKASIDWYRKKHGSIVYSKQNQSNNPEIENQYV